MYMTIFFTNLCRAYRTSVHVSLELSRGVPGAVLTKQRLKSYFGFWNLFSVSSQPVTYVVLTDIPAPVCLPQREHSSSLNTPRLTGRFTAKCKNQKQIAWVSLRCTMCQRRPDGRSGCSLIQKVHVHAVCGWRRKKQYVSVEFPK